MIQMQQQMMDHVHIQYQDVQIQFLNYDPNATTDDGSCTYPLTITTTVCYILVQEL